MNIKTQDLTGPALDWAVAKCEWVPWTFETATTDEILRDCHYSTDWSLAGPIIERETICADYLLNGKWLAVSRITERQGYGPTPLIAAMRCYVASKMGDEIEIPNELEGI